MDHVDAEAMPSPSAVSEKDVLVGGEPYLLICCRKGDSNLLLAEPFLDGHAVLTFYTYPENTPRWSSGYGRPLPQGYGGAGCVPSRSRRRRGGRGHPLHSATKWLRRRLILVVGWMGGAACPAGRPPRSEVDQDDDEQEETTKPNEEAIGNVVHGGWGLGESGFGGVGADGPALILPSLHSAE